MSSKKKFFMVLGILVIIGVSFVIGLFVGQRNAPETNLSINRVDTQTFYACIESINEYNDGSIHINVKGLEINDINYRGDFTFKVDDNIDMSWRGEKINISDLKEGDNISITFADETLYDISPTPLQEVLKVQLLEDEIKKQENEINNKVTTIDIQTTGLSSATPMKKYTLNQEEIYVIFSIIDNLTFSEKTCDGFPTYFIKYNSEEKEGFVYYGIEIFENEYHITSNDNEEAILTNEQKEQLDKIINKL